MKKLLLAAAVIATSAHAQQLGQTQEMAAHYAEPSIYAGLKVGAFKTLGIDKNPLAVSAVAGYQINQNYGVEAEYAHGKKITYKKDESITHLKNGAPEDKEKWTPVEYTVKPAQSIGLYGTYQYHFEDLPVYIKGKLGVVNTKTQSEKRYIIKDTKIEETTDAAGETKTVDKSTYQPTLGVNSRSETGLGVGVAAGYRLTNSVNLEAGYTRLDSKVSLMNVGATLQF